MDRKSRERGRSGDQRGGQGLAFAGRHLGQHALEHGECADDLDVEVPLAEHAVRQLADEREGAGDLTVRQIRMAAQRQRDRAHRRREVVERERAELVGMLRPPAARSGASARARQGAARATISAPAISVTRSSGCGGRSERSG